MNASTPAGKLEVCAAFQDVVRACSSSTHTVRSPSFTDDELDVPQETDEEKVRVIHAEWVKGRIHGRS